MPNHQPTPGEPADRFADGLDRLSADHRIAIVTLCERFINETLQAGIDAGVIDASRAEALKTLAAGPR
jgi:hypothetical protein